MGTVPHRTPHSRCLDLDPAGNTVDKIPPLTHVMGEGRLDWSSDPSWSQNRVAPLQDFFGTVTPTPESHLGTEGRWQEATCALGMDPFPTGLALSQ